MPESTDLVRAGLTPRVAELLAPLLADGFCAGRVVRVDRGMPLVLTDSGIVRAEPAPQLARSASDVSSRAAVGDWVALSRPPEHDVWLLEAIVPRQGLFARKDPGEHRDEQVLAANIDFVFVMQALTGTPNIRRLERELVLAWESGAQPVVLLSKADLWHGDIEPVLEEVAAATPGVAVHVTSGITGQGIDEIARLLADGATGVLLGASGVGKSTLVNRLSGEETQETADVREADGKGRHTTVARELLSLPSGGSLIDTPGMRALAMWDAEDGLSAAFPDITERIASCRFRDCAHESEPGCAVRAAVASGELPERRLESYRDLQAELAATGARRRSGQKRTR